MSQTKKITVREALRDAMAEEMKSDEKVFIMGEEVAEYQGAYKVTQGLLQEFGSKRVIDTPINRYCCWICIYRIKTYSRIYDI
jgi:pyruvate dehydrogenase E1 component beta subunit